MRRLILVVITIVSTICFANAHSPLTSSIPKTSQTVDAPFESFHFTFGENVKLVKITVEAENGTRTDLDLLENNASQLEHVINIDPIDPGFYVVYWRALSEDGHPIKGSIPFKVR